MQILLLLFEAYEIFYWCEHHNKIFTSNIKAINSSFLISKFNVVKLKNDKNNIDITKLSIINSKNKYQTYSA